MCTRAGPVAEYVVSYKPTKISSMLVAIPIFSSYRRRILNRNTYYCKSALKLVIPLTVKSDSAHWKNANAQYTYMSRGNSSTGSDFVQKIEVMLAPTQVLL